MKRLLTFVAAVSACWTPACASTHQRNPGRDAGALDSAAPAGDTGAGRDAARPDSGPDASPARDAASMDGVYWTVERRAANIAFANQLGCQLVVGGSATLHLRTQLNSSCELLGPAFVDTDAAVAVAYSWVWVRHGDPNCTPINSVELRTFTWTVTAPGQVRVIEPIGGQEVTLSVAADSGSPCGRAGAPGAACSRDCDCSLGLRCLVDLGDYAACTGGRCFAACDPPGAGWAGLLPNDFGCPYGQRCISGQAPAAPSCAPRTMDACVNECAPGLMCIEGDAYTSCDWAISLNASVRHACNVDSDCSAGLHCVERTSTGERSCEVPCWGIDTLCPPMHTCGVGSANTDWVCEWLGE